MKKLFTKVIIFIMLFSSFSCMLPTTVEAQGLKDAFGVNDGNNNDNLDATADSAGYDTNDADTKFNTVISLIIQTILGLLGVIFMALMLYGGFLWMTARGNESQVEKSKNLITAAIIGLAIVIGAYAITRFIISGVGSGLIT